jgi:rieske iron-sulfur protein
VLRIYHTAACDSAVFCSTLEKTDPTARTSTLPRKRSRRKFLGVLVAIGAALLLTPTVVIPLVQQYLLGGSAQLLKGKQKVVVDNNSFQGSAAGRAVNVNDLETFPPNSSWRITYPSSGNATTDGQNPNAFEKFELIRLPSELGGESKDAAAFVAFSVVCTHLWCSLNYDPHQPVNPTENGYRPDLPPHQDLECPCHGNIYRLPDGMVTAGPSFLDKKPPVTALPYLALAADSEGFLWIEPPIWDYQHNGVVGYGRNVV